MTLLTNRDDEGQVGDTFVHETVGELLAIPANEKNDACKGCIQREEPRLTCTMLPGCAGLIWVKDTPENRLIAITHRMKT